MYEGQFDGLLSKQNTIRQIKRTFNDYELLTLPRSVQDDSKFQGDS